MRAETSQKTKFVHLTDSRCIEKVARKRRSSNTYSELFDVSRQPVDCNTIMINLICMVVYRISFLKLIP